MKIIKSLLLVMALLLSNVSSASLMLWLDPAEQPGSTGDDITLTLMAGGLDAGGPVSLGAFDLDILFDPSVLSFTGYTFFDGLGDLLFFEALDFSVGEYAPGAVGLSEVSLLPPGVLDATQPAEFALAELTFHIDLLDAADFTIVSISPSVGGFFPPFSDSLGLAIDPVAMRSALIGTPPTVPEPASFVLLSLALALVAVRKKLKLG
ncbi:PEP-CTERM protein-sorting domain-containing protein [Colwellia chukchiensis]|uniref:PEP-CTERM protein-sorting domain-containing protein n=1 Tax=Colwellia chukchiensis TaxID=641665 RepID=A0A1H7GTA0_9GAMM|nr:PEP-CTERM sorting domain-containing protein [Colwellia chukchiensis]SEK41331.1 PEP-CTERM protein-sorting domain-containing protein [Colwellia chukchiensis]